VILFTPKAPFSQLFLPVDMLLNRYTIVYGYSLWDDFNSGFLIVYLDKFA